MNSNNNNILLEDSIVESDITLSSIGMGNKEMAEKIQKLEDHLNKMMNCIKNGGDQSGSGMMIGWTLCEKFGKMDKEMEELKKVNVGLKEENGELKEEMAKMKKKMEEMKEIVDELKAAKDEEDRKVAEIQEYHKRMQEEAKENNSVSEVDQEQNYMMAAQETEDSNVNEGQKQEAEEANENGGQQQQQDYEIADELQQERGDTDLQGPLSYRYTHRCKLCSITSSVGGGYLAMHIRKYHIRKAMFKCPFCPHSSIYSEIVVKKHIYNKHNSFKKPISYRAEYEEEFKKYKKLCFPTSRIVDY